MWHQRTIQVLIEGSPSKQEALGWISRALPSFHEQVNEAFVTGSKVPNGTLLLEVGLGEARFAKLKTAPQSLDFTAPASWTSVANAFAVGIAQVASQSGRRGTVIDSRLGSAAWVVLCVGTDSAGAQLKGGVGSVLKEGQWIEDRGADVHAGELITRALGRSIWTLDDYLEWWQSSYRSELEVVVPPSPVVWQGRRVQDLSRDPREVSGSRAWRWLKQKLSPAEAEPESP